MTTTRYYFGGAVETESGVVTKYYSFGGQMVATLAPGASAGVKEGTTLKYFLSDHASTCSAQAWVQPPSCSTRMVQSPNNNATCRLCPEGVFGAPRVKPPFAAITSTDLTYTGQRKLDSGMGGIMDYKARFYSPYINRFLQPDTIIPGVANPQAWNRYSYVYNQPINLNDPTGHCPTCLLGAIAGAIVLTAVVYATHPNLTPQDYVQAAIVGATAGLLIGSGVGMPAGVAMASTLIGAGTGVITGAGAYALTAGDSYSTQEMASEALIGGATGALASLTGPAFIGTQLANSGRAILARAAISGGGAMTSQISHNMYFDDPHSGYPAPSELGPGAVVGGVSSGFGDVADSIVTSVVTAFSGSKTAGRIAGSLSYNFVKNIGAGVWVNKKLGWIECLEEGGSNCR